MSERNINGMLPLQWKAPNLSLLNSINIKEKTNNIELFNAIKQSLIAITDVLYGTAADDKPRYIVDLILKRIRAELSTQLNEKNNLSNIEQLLVLNKDKLEQIKANLQSSKTEENINFPIKLIIDLIILSIKSLKNSYSSEHLVELQQKLEQEKNKSQTNEESDDNNSTLIQLKKLDTADVDDTETDNETSSINIDEIVKKIENINSYIVSSITDLTKKLKDLNLEFLNINNFDVIQSINKLNEPKIENTATIGVTNTLKQQDTTTSNTVDAVKKTDTINKPVVQSNKLINNVEEKQTKAIIPTTVTNLALDSKKEKKNSKKLKKLFIKLITSNFNKIFNTINNFTTLLEEHIISLNKLLGNILKAINANNLTVLLGIFLVLGAAIIASSLPLLLSFIEKFPFVEKIKAFFKEAKLKDYILDLINNFISKAPDLIIKALIGIKDSFVNKLKRFVDDIMQFGKDVWEWITGKSSEHKNELTANEKKIEKHALQQIDKNSAMLDLSLTQNVLSIEENTTKNLELLAGIIENSTKNATAETEKMAGAITSNINETSEIANLSVDTINNAQTEVSNNIELQADEINNSTISNLKNDVEAQTGDAVQSVDNNVNSKITEANEKVDKELANMEETLKKNGPESGVKLSTLDKLLREGGEDAVDLKNPMTKTDDNTGPKSMDATTINERGKKVTLMADKAQIENNKKATSGVASVASTMYYKDTSEDSEHNLQQLLTVNADSPEFNINVYDEYKNIITNTDNIDKLLNENTQTIEELNKNINEYCTELNTSIRKLTDNANKLSVNIDNGDTTTINNNDNTNIVMLPNRQAISNPASIEND